MKHRPLIIDDAAVKRITSVVVYAETNRLNIHDVMRNLSSKVPVGADLRRLCEVSLGYRCCFSIEQQPSGWMRHLSISVDDGAVTARPHPIAIAALMPHFGFKNKLEHCLIYDETEARAINILEPIE